MALHAAHETQNNAQSCRACWISLHATSGGPFNLCPRVAEQLLCGAQPWMGGVVVCCSEAMLYMVAVLPLWGCAAGGHFSSMLPRVEEQLLPAAQPHNGQRGPRYMHCPLQPLQGTHWIWNSGPVCVQSSLQTSPVPLMWPVTSALNTLIYLVFSSSES